MQACMRSPGSKRLITTRVRCESSMHAAESATEDKKAQRCRIERVNLGLTYLDVADRSPPNSLPPYRRDANM